MPTDANTGQAKSLVKIAKEQGKIFGWVETSSAYKIMDLLRTEAAVDLSKAMESRRPGLSDGEYIHLLETRWPGPVGFTMLSLPKGTGI